MGKASAAKQDKQDAAKQDQGRRTRIAAQRAASPVATAAGGTANYLTAAICGLTNDQPGFACTAVVSSLRAKF